MKSYKRFYKEASTQPAEAGWQVALDGRPLQTPRKAPLLLPTEALAEAVAQEWAEQGAQMRPDSMPLTQIASGVCDLTPEEQARLVSHMAGYIDGDMLYFREEGHRDLFPRQQAEWEPWLRWAEQRYDVHFERQFGLSPTSQSPEVHQRLHETLARLPLTKLVPVNVLATGFGSLLLGLAVLEGALPVEQAFDLSIIEQQVQTERWGLEDEQHARNEELRAEVIAAARFLTLLSKL